MPQQDLHYEIRDVPTDNGDLVLELYAEGNRLATARAAADVVANIESQLGTPRNDVRGNLETALVKHLKRQLDKVQVTTPSANPPSSLRFVSRYTYRDFDDISVGLVWYDVPSSTTGPEELPAIIRNKMRFEVHSVLTEQSPNTKGIVDLLG